MTIGQNAGKCHRRNPDEEVNTDVAQAESVLSGSQQIRLVLVTRAK
jgi:hypothetical protein